MSEDPIGFEANDTNLYRYVRNSPTNGVDPAGLVSLAPFIKIGKGALEAVGALQTLAELFGGGITDWIAGGNYSQWYEFKVESSDARSAIEEEIKRFKNVNGKAPDGIFGILTVQFREVDVLINDYGSEHKIWTWYPIPCLPESGDIPIAAAFKFRLKLWYQESNIGEPGTGAIHPGTVHGTIETSETDFNGKSRNGSDHFEDGGNDLELQVRYTLSVQADNAGQPGRNHWPAGPKTDVLGKPWTNIGTFEVR